MSFWTTLRRLREHNACEDRYPILRKALGPKYGQDTPIDLLFILESNGVKDCLWELQNNHEDQPEREQVRRILAAGFAERVLPLYEKLYPGDMRPRIAVETACLYAFGLATSGEMCAARDTARAAGAAARAVAWDADDAAGDAVWAAARAAAAGAAARAAARAAAGAAARAAAGAADAAARDAAGDAVWAAAWATAWATARAVAWDAAWAAAMAAERKWQAGYIRHVLAWAEARKLSILKEGSDGR